MNKPLKYYFVSIILTFLAFYILKINFSQTMPFSSKNNSIYKNLLPSDYELLKRTFPHFDYDKMAYKEAIRELRKMKAIRKIAKSNNNKINANWQFVGPTNVGGRVVDIEFNPKDPRIVYAAAATGGVFKSIDTGLNWFAIFDDQPCLTIGDIGIDPNNPDIIYVGTGEANGGHNNFPGLGIYKSYDAGNSWQFIGLDSTVSVGRIIVDPSNSQRVFVAAVGSYFKPNSQRGVYLSEDGGTTWQNSLFVSDSTGAIDLVIDPSNSNTLYAAMWERVRRPAILTETHLYGPSGGIFKTTDGGKNWIKFGIGNGLPDPDSAHIGRIGLAISKSNPSTLYATYNDGSFLYAIYKSSNGGNNWILVNSSFNGSGNFSWYFGQVRVHPLNPETVFVLDVSLLKSTTSGNNWDFSYGYNGPQQLHVDHHAMAFNPDNPDYILSGNDGGINISQDGGKTWSLPVHLPITQFYEIGLDYNNPAKLYGGTQDNGTVRTSTGSENAWTKILSGDGFYALVDNQNPNIIYAEKQFGELWKSIDGGLIFNPALNGIVSAEPTNWSTPIVMDPHSPNILYYGTHTLYRSVNSADSWEAVSPKLTDYTFETRLGTITTIAVAPTNSNIIYAGTDDSHVWITTDYGTTWKDVSAELPYRWVTRVVVDPKNENVVYVTFSGLRWADPEPRVFRSGNLGESWTNISAGLPDAPVNAFAVDNNNTDILYLGNDIGAFVSYDRGATWEILADQLPIVVVNDMKIHPTENYLAIGTHGRGMYKIDLNQINSADVSNNQIPINFSLSQNYPNPFNPTTTIQYTIPSSVILNSFQNLKNQISNQSMADKKDWNDNINVRLSVYDILGREVTTLVNEVKKPGEYQVQFDAANYSSGIYYYKLSVNSFTETKKMILLK